jgi:ABC-type branched-subunit amino acid transport system permease subunit
MVKILKTTNAMENSSDLMKKLARNLETPSRQWYMWVAFLSVIVLFGVYALIRQIQEGQIITGMRDNAVRHA